MAKRKTAKFKLNKQLVIGIVALLLAAVLVVVWAIGSNGFKENNPVKWSWWGGNAGNGGDELDNKDNEVVPAGEGMLMLTPRTTLNSPVALAAQTDTKTKTATLTASVEPENGFISSVTWRASATAITLTQDEENPLKVAVELTGALTETAQITCIVQSFKTVTATCDVDYIARSIISTMVEMTNPLLPIGGEFVVSFSRDISNSTLKPLMRVVEARIGYYAQWDNLLAFETKINEKLGINETGWAHSRTLNFTEVEQSENSAKINLSLPEKISELVGKPESVSEDDFAKAVYSLIGKVSSRHFCLAFKIELIYNDIVYYVCDTANNAEFKQIGINPETYLTGVEGVTITDGNIVFTD
ncbi:MAG: hypothetical protein NC131_17530 [Roseburia sp.]|nr:hypothetical protein [Roseburia sp.]